MSDKKPKMLSIPCILCKTQFQISPEELRQQIKNFGEYIIRHESMSTITVVQAGSLCDSCLQKPLEQRVIKKSFKKSKI
jgi:hypothetical protein